MQAIGKKAKQSDKVIVLSTDGEAESVGGNGKFKVFDLLFLLLLLLLFFLIQTTRTTMMR